MSETDEGLEDLPTDIDEEEEEEEEEEDVWTVYDSDTFISGPFQSDDCTISEDILEFQFSFGYDCRRYFNLVTADPDHLVFASGNLINFFNVETREISFRRSALGGGIGHIKTNPNPEYDHIAIAENGDNPLIIIYEWPNLNINCVLKGGSSKIYCNLDYSPDGLLLVSQGGEPDYLITIWNWPKRRILLRTKSYVNTVFRVKFSPAVPGQLTSCGLAHIKFWKMANTFTGLKLKGELGRFGKTEFSDILGVLPMPDEKVVSGCTWGNILVWDAGLIKLEVFRTLRRKCHDAPIIQFHFMEEELWTVGMDGHVKVWWYEKIDQADPPDDDRVVQIEPTYDFYTEGLMILCLRKRYPDPGDTHYFAQDGNGGIWDIDLNTESAPQPAVQLYKCHAGKVVDMATCPWGPYFVSLGSGGKLQVYNYIERKLIYQHRFPAPGACLIWIPLKTAEYGDELILAFEDGTIRLCVLTIEDNPEASTLGLLEIIKPHQKSVTKMSFNNDRDIFVTGGEDATIFIFQVVTGERVTLIPIGFIPVPTPVTCLTWHHETTDEILVGCLRGEIVQVAVPRFPQYYTTVSYNLKLNPKHNSFKSYKAQIRRDLKIEEIQLRKAEKVERKRKEMNKLKADNPGLDIDEDVFLADSDTEEELEPLHIPEVPNRVIWMQSTDDDTIWLSMGGYDAGYIYEYRIEQTSEVPHFFKMITDADDVEISSYVYNYNKKYLIFAMQNGEIRVNKINGNFRELSNYWSLAMHDNISGFVPTMCFSFDERYFFTCGHDNNIFSFKFNPEDNDYIPENLISTCAKRTEYPLFIQDSEYYTKLSLEQASLKAENDRIENLTNANKQILRDKIKVLSNRFSKLLERNKKLNSSQKFTMQEFEVDERVTDHLEKKLFDEIELTKRKLAFDVEKSKLGVDKLRWHFIDPLDCFPITVSGINRTVQVGTFKHIRKIPPNLDKMMRIAEEKILEAELKGRPPERPPAPPKPPYRRKSPDRKMEHFLISLSTTVMETKFGPKLTRLLTKYRKRKLKWDERNEEWNEFMSRKPVKGVNHPEDETALAEATVTIGDYKLKSADNYKIPQNERATTAKKYKELLTLRIKKFNVGHDFNQKVYNLRAKKVQTRHELKTLQEELGEIHTEIPDWMVNKVPPVDDIERESEFPERNLEATAVLNIEENKLREKTFEVVPEPGRDFAEKLVLPEDHDVASTRQFAKTVPKLQFESFLNYTENEEEDTPFESEVRRRRLTRKLFEQDQIIKRITHQIGNFNDEIVELAEEKIQVEVDWLFMRILILTLHQELMILKNFEQLEDDLQEQVHRRTTEVLDMRDMIASTGEQINEHEKQTGKLHERGKSIQNSFTQAVQDNKFFLFLKRVFRKKFKVQKIRTNEDSSSESSSSSSSSSSDADDDGASIDSRDFGIIKQDLNVCPKGCDPELYNLTVSLRSQRHEVEQKIRDEIRTVEVLKKDLEMQNKKVKLVEKTMQTSQQELEEFQREKQKKLNEVHCTVAIKINQLQHFTPQGEAANILNTLIFSKQILSKLYRRVDQLQRETEQQISKHSVNINHMGRMRTDCKYMAKDIKQLQTEIVDIMLLKFGRVIDISIIEEQMLKRTFGEDDLTNLEEVVLKKLVRDLRMELLDLRALYESELKLWKSEENVWIAAYIILCCIQLGRVFFRRAIFVILCNLTKNLKDRGNDNIRKAQIELRDTLHESTSRQDLLTVLSKEKATLIHSVSNQPKKREHLHHLTDTFEKYKAEIKKLEAIVARQNEQLQELKDEIKRLRTKGLPSKQPTPEQPQELVPVWETVEEPTVEEEETEEVSESKPFSISIPRLLGEESEQVVAEVLREMFDALNMELSKKSEENFIKDIISSMLCCASVQDIIDALIRSMPIEPDDEQQDIIETAAEQLYSIQEPEDDPEACSKSIMENILDDAMLSTDGANEVVRSMVDKLVDKLPMEFIMRTESIEYIAAKILDSGLNLALDQHELLAEQATNQQFTIILNEILNKVFDTGIDYLYYID